MTTILERFNISPNFMTFSFQVLCIILKKLGRIVLCFVSTLT